METKLCKKCNIVKPITDMYIYKIKEGKEYRGHQCIACQTLYLAQWHKNNIERRHIANAKRYQLNKELIHVQGKVYRKNNRKKIHLHVMRKLHSDPLFRCKEGIRARIRSSIKQGGYAKKSKTHQILGCSFSKFISYIELKFTKGMTWENHGDWHFDHIIPLKQAKTEEEMIKLNHYTNFQPLWATSKIAEKYGEFGYIGNLEKGDKLINYSTNAEVDKSDQSNLQSADSSHPSV